MKDSLKQAAPYILIAIVAFLTGSFVALHYNSEYGCYFQGKFGENIEFSLGRNEITDFDFASVKKEDAIQLGAQIELLSYKDNLSIELRKLKDQATGPFKEFDIEIIVKFTDDKNFNGPIAQACRGEVLNKQLNIFRIIEPANIALNVNEMRDFSVLVEKEKNYCGINNTEGKTIWINEEAAHTWFKTGEGILPTAIKAKASIIRTILFPSNKGLITSSMTEQIQNSET